ncbi:LacI family DNA-binding transcriptional regulator [Streptomyces sp. NBRC 109706]|uniref:LacI family DNA-binding transcriptional regulator n=1 Tax=Streptomyces sp. NBRC 109706 TaxID=1550035 RepID=UPI00078196B1|nr:LacI family DNA-binding transcriptional regulator [Streptomyces sp. NBRC 109706]
MDGTGAASRSAGPTMAAVARAAGVSVPTVSKVLNGRPGIAPETRRLVVLAARRLGYARPTAADRTAGRPLLELVTDRLDRPRTAAVLQAVERAARLRGFRLLVSVAPPPSRWEREPVDWLPRPRRLPRDGLLFHLDTLPLPVYERLLDHGARFVMVDPETAPPHEVRWVATANRLAGAQAAEHLLALGHRRIAVVTGAHGSAADRARVAGFRATLAARGLGVPGNLVCSPGPGSVRRAVGAVLERADRPTAFFGSAEALGPVVFRECAARGVRVPEDVSVVGFGEPPFEWCGTRELTAVCRPVGELAAEALALLLDGGGRPRGGAWAELPPRLRVGASTGPPAASPTDGPTPARA